MQLIAINRLTALIYIYIYIYIYIIVILCNRGVTAHVFVPNRFDTGLSVRYACVPNENSIYLFFSGNSNNKWRFGSLWCDITDRCINASESRLWDGSETCWYKPNTSIDSSDHRSAPVPVSEPWRTADLCRAWVNAIIRSSVLLVLTWINMTEHLMPHVIAQSVFQPRKDIKKKCHAACHLPQQVISVHSSLVH